MDQPPMEIQTCSPGLVVLRPVKRGKRAVSPSLIGATVKELGSIEANA